MFFIVKATGAFEILDDVNDDRVLMLDPTCSQESFEAVTRGDEYSMIAVRGETSLRVPPHFKQFTRLKIALFSENTFADLGNFSDNVEVTIHRNLPPPPQDPEGARDSDTASTVSLEEVKPLKLWVRVVVFLYVSLLMISVALMIYAWNMHSEGVCASD